MIPLDRPLILASSSPRRCDLLSAVGLRFTQRPSEVEERILPGESPEAFVLRMAHEKADRARQGGPDRCLVLGCDTVVVVGDRVLGKPRDRAEGRKMLRSLMGRTHLVLSGVAMLLLPEEHWAVGVSQTRVTFQAIPSAALEAYLDTEEYRDKAGAYALQGIGGVFVERVEGSPSNVVGLPVRLFARLAREAGLVLPAFGDALAPPRPGSGRLEAP